MTCSKNVESCVVASKAIQTFEQIGNWIVIGFSLLTPDEWWLWWRQAKSKYKKHCSVRLPTTSILVSHQANRWRVLFRRPSNLRSDFFSKVTALWLTGRWVLLFMVTRKTLVQSRQICVVSGAGAPQWRRSSIRQDVLLTTVICVMTRLYLAVGQKLVQIFDFCRSNLSKSLSFYHLHWLANGFSVLRK